MSAKKEEKKSVKSYQQDIEAEKQHMSSYSKRFATTVRSLQANFRQHNKELKEAALKMREDGAKHMKAKINKFKGEIKTSGKAMDENVDKFKQDIKDQVKENKEAVSHIEKNVKYLLSEINKKKNDFQAYAKGPFQDYIKAFWG